jgi:hypothetical protein
LLEDRVRERSKSFREILSLPDAWFLDISGSAFFRVEVLRIDCDKFDSSGFLGFLAE